MAVQAMNTQAVPDAPKATKVKGGGGGAKKLLWVLVVLILAAGAAYAGYWYAGDRAKSDKAALQKQVDDLKVQLKKASAPTAAKKLTFTETAFSLQTLTGWTKGDPKTGPVTTANAYYSDAAGDYFAVEVDPPGHGISSDASWTLAANSAGDGVKLSSEGATCTASSDAPFCSAGDGKLQLVAAIGLGSGATSADTMLKGHHYYFYFGNTKKETGVDLKVFREILASFKAK